MFSYDFLPHRSFPENVYFRPMEGINRNKFRYCFNEVIIVNQRWWLKAS